MRTAEDPELGQLGAQAQASILLGKVADLLKEMPSVRDRITMTTWPIGRFNGNCSMTNEVRIPTLAERAALVKRFRDARQLFEAWSTASAQCRLSVIRNGSNRSGTNI